jgi:CheY-like chemotaxis protein
VLDHPVAVRSVFGQGSMFAVEVPLTAPVPVAVSAPAPAPVPAADLADLAVLCIDNEPAILEGMETLLTGWGCHVTTATGPREALATLRDVRSPPDVMLVDYHLDEGTGIDAVTQLRWRFGPSVPAALVTANRSPTLREEAAARNIAVLFKPVKPAALRAFLAQQRRSRTAAE